MTMLDLSDPNSSLTPHQYRPPTDLTLHTLKVAFSKSYGKLSGDAFMSEFLVIRDTVIPAFEKGEDVLVTHRHITTLLTTLNAFENMCLERYSGDRTMRRAACNREDPGVLKAITDARKEMSKINVRLPDGRTMSL